LIKLRALAVALGFAVVAVGLHIQPAAAATAPVSEAEAVVRWSKNQLGKPYRLGANGLRRFDCSGLVYRTFLEKDLLTRIGGNRTSRGYYNWFKERGQITSNPRKGDLVVWGRRGQPVSHIGIYLGINRYGQRMALSALTSGVAVHKVKGINLPVRAYLRVKLDR
jgi:cell wall-associated NlpC family hydrolase